MDVELVWAVEPWGLGSSVPGDNEAIMVAAVGVVNRSLMDTAAVIPVIPQNVNSVACSLDRRRVLDTLREPGTSELTIRLNYRIFSRP